MRRYLFGILVLIVFCGYALAGTVTYDQTAALGGTNPAPDTSSVTSSTFAFNDFLSFPKWDPSLFPGSTLKSVVFGLTGDISGSLTLTNRAASAGTFSGRTDVTLTMFINTGGVTTLITVPYYATGSFPLASGGSSTIGGLTSGPVTNTAKAITTGLSSFIYTGGSSTYSLPLSGDILNSATWSTSTAPDISGSSTATAYGTVTYNYGPSPVPEPATMALMGSALAGLGLLVRRRRSA